MPLIRVPGGYKWGKGGKVYATREKAQKQAKAIAASKAKKTKKGKG